VTTREFELRAYFNSGLAQGADRERRRIRRAQIALLDRLLKAYGDLPASTPLKESLEIHRVHKELWNSTRAPRAKRRRGK